MTKDTVSEYFKKAIAPTIAVILGTVSTLSWFSTNYVSASEFKDFRRITFSSIQRVDLNNQKTQLEIRNAGIQDRVFEIISRANSTHSTTSVEEAQLERYRRELDQNEARIRALEYKLNSQMTASKLDTIESGLFNN